jgi:ABC-type Fe3+/spermidine/putrescine transport system ATPase subunit/nucleotide-binding universal stress UspA family protein
MSIVLESITARYGNHLIVDRVSLGVSDGEMFVLLGASGSGKSTILKMIAGLTHPDEGRILLHGRDVTLLPPQRRGIGFVFQNYSIFSHMSVEENIEFGLKIRRVRRKERVRRRQELLHLVGLAGLGRRYASQLSGGQQQRVALARALAYEPEVLLLDEPFGALDVKIRSQLRRSLKEIQRKLGITTILVTHDQEEAFELADRIGVLDRGRLLEVGDGESLYARPKTLFVATFLGAGSVLVGRARSGRAHFGSLSLAIPSDVPHEDGARVQLLFRPEQVVLSEDTPAETAPVLGRATILERSFAGALQRVRLRLPRLAATRQIAPALPFGEEGLVLDAALPAEQKLVGQEFWVSLSGWHILKQPDWRLLVCATKPSSEKRFAVVGWLADRLSAAATLLAVARDPRDSAAARQSLERLREAAGVRQCEMRVRYGDSAEQILNEQNETLYEILMLTPWSAVRPAEARGEGLGKTVTRVLDGAQVPVMIMKGERREFSRVLICTAAGEPGKGDVLVGGRLARRLGAAVRLLYVTRGPGELDPRAKMHLADAAATLRSLDVASEIAVRESLNAHEGILAEAREGNFDLVVVGGHGPRVRRSMFRRDDVTMKVIAGAEQPVLVVPAEGV